jgi:membrane fusion protein (multidrug efflux system)
MSESTEGNGSAVAQERPKPRGADGGGAGQPEAFARVQEPPPEAPKKPPLYKRPVPMIILGSLLLAAIAVGLLYYLHVRDWETTDDAFIQGDVTQVSPRVAGHVQSVYITDNQDVHLGDKLVQLDPADLQAKGDEAQAAVVAAQKVLVESQDLVTSAEADVGQAKAAEEAAQTESNRAHNELNRFESLPPQAVTQQQLINFRAAANSADANLAAAKQKTLSAISHVKSAQSQVEVAAAQVKQAQATLNEDMLQLSYTTITAPIAGYVTNKSVQQGDYVQVGQALVALVPHNQYVIANFKETQLDEMRPGQEVQITIDAYPGHKFNGKVDSIQRGSGAAFSLLPPENATGNYVKVVQRVPVKILGDFNGFVIGPGMSVVPRVKVR